MDIQFNSDNETFTLKNILNLVKKYSYITLDWLVYITKIDENDSSGESIKEYQFILKNIKKIEYSSDTLYIDHEKRIPISNQPGDYSITDGKEYCKEHKIRLAVKYFQDKENMLYCYKCDKYFQIH